MAGTLPNSLGQLEAIEAMPNPQDVASPPVAARRGSGPERFLVRPTLVFLLSLLSFLTVLRWQMGEGHTGMLMLVEQGIGALGLFIEVVCRDPIGLGYFAVTAIMGALLDVSRCLEEGPLASATHWEQSRAAGLSHIHLLAVCAAVQALCAIAAWQLYRDTEAEMEFAVLVAEEVLYGSVAAAERPVENEPSAPGPVMERKMFTGCAMKIQ
mmetsp:Transcript_73/g.196  ORF Transcript_73/g.196 Transcript_73/m.196 type:complete len:211 (+) Transcript_73:72-704(+)